MEDIKVVPKNCFEVYREKENGINAVVAPPPPPDINRAPAFRHIHLVSQTVQVMHIL